MLIDVDDGEILQSLKRLAQKGGVLLCPEGTADFAAL